LRAQYFGFVFQASYLIAARTAAENVELGLLHKGIPRRQRRIRASEALQAVGLTHRANAQPHTLSGGERQRVAVARALISAPNILLCDEPTGNLDSTNTSVVLDLLDELNSNGLTVIVVTHDETIAARSQLHLRVSDGSVEAHKSAGIERTQKTLKSSS
jgi:putative ABC transport system ATP-binding protein